MSVILRKCPIIGCKFNNRFIYSDEKQITSHLQNHDYQEKLEAALRLGIIPDIRERRAPKWINEHLAVYSGIDA